MLDDGNWSENHDGNWVEYDEGSILLDFPEDMSPHKPGSMSISCAALCIASKEGQLKINSHDEKAWADAFEKLLGRIVQGEVIVKGLRGNLLQGSPYDLPEEIPSRHFIGLQVIYPFQQGLEFILSEQRVLDCNYQHVDNLQCRWGIYWNDLQICRSDIAKHFSDPNPIGIDTPLTDENSAKDQLLLTARKKTVLEIIAECWPHGIPRGLSAKERDQKIGDVWKEKGHGKHGVSGKTIQRALRTLRDNERQSAIVP